MATVESLCKSALLLKEGKIIFSGKSSEIISKYRESMEESFELPLSKELPEKVVENVN